MNQNFCLVFSAYTLLQRVKACPTEEDQEKLMQITSLLLLNAFLLPIKTVGVQVSYVSSLTGIELAVCLFVCLQSLNLKLLWKIKCEIIF